MSLDPPLPVKSRTLFSSPGGGKRDCVFYYIFCLFLEKGILEYIARRPIIQTFYGSGRANRTLLV